MSTERTSKDLNQLADEIETRLGLKDVESKQFSAAMLSAEGLRQSREPFQDFEDGGQLVVFLVTNPGPEPAFEPKPQDLMLHFAPLDEEITAIFDGILGTDLLVRARALSGAEREQVQTGYPIFWKISDYYESSYLSPEEAKLLTEECLRLQHKSLSTKALRGLDKLMRIGDWAYARHYGVLLSAP